MSREYSSDQVRAFLKLDDTEYWRVVREAHEQVEFMHAAAMAQVRRNRDANVRPQVLYRCARGCELFTAWKHPNSVIVSHTGVRAPASRLEDKPGSEVIHAQDARLPTLSGGAMSGAFVAPPRAYQWAPGTTIPILCDHLYGDLGDEFAPVLEAEIAASLKTRTTRRVRVSVPQPDRTTHKS